MTAGCVGRPHGHDGRFYVEDPRHSLPPGTELTVDGRGMCVASRAGMDSRPLIRLAELDDPNPLRGALLLVEQELAADEWLASDLVGCVVAGCGVVRRVLPGPSCSLLELEEGMLVPFVSDAIRSVDVAARSIRPNLDFLGET